MSLPMGKRLPGSGNSCEIQAPYFIQALDPCRRIRFGNDIALTIEIAGKFSQLNYCTLGRQIEIYVTVM